MHQRFALLDNYNTGDNYTIYCRVIWENRADGQPYAASINNPAESFGPPVIVRGNALGVTHHIRVAEYSHMEFYGPVYFYKFNLFGVFPLPVNITQLLGRNANVQLPTKINDIGINSDLTGDQYAQYAQVIFSQRMYSFKDLKISPHPINRPTYLSFQQHPELENVLQEPERHVLVDPLTGEEKQYHYLYKPFGKDTIKGCPVFRISHERNSDFIRASGITPRLRFQIQDQFLNIILRKRVELSEHPFFSGMTEEDIKTKLTQIRAFNSVLSGKFDTDHHQHFTLSLYESFGEYILGQNVPFTRLLYGHATWNVNKISLPTTWYETAKHYISLYLGYQHFSYYYQQWEESFEKSIEEIELFVDHQRNREKRYDIDGIITGAIFAFITSLGLLSTMLWVTPLGTEWALLCAAAGFTPYMIVLGLIAVFLYDFDLGTDTTTLTTSQLLFRSFIAAFKMGVNMMVALLSVICSFLFLPTRVLRSICFSDLDSTWFRKYQVDELNGRSQTMQFICNLFCFGGYLDIALTLVESAALIILLQSSWVSLAILFAASEILTLSSMIYHEWAPVIVAKFKHHAEVIDHYSDSVGADKLSAQISDNISGRVHTWCEKLPSMPRLFAS